MNLSAAASWSDRCLNLRRRDLSLARLLNTQTQVLTPSGTKLFRPKTFGGRCICLHLANFIPISNAPGSSDRQSPFSRSCSKSRRKSRNCLLAPVAAEEAQSIFR